MYKDNNINSGEYPPANRHAPSVSDRLHSLGKELLGRSAIGESLDGSSVITFSYQRLISDADAAAILISELSQKGSPISLHGGSSYDSAVIFLACSSLKRRLIISDGLEDVMLLTDPQGEPISIDLNELRALISGVLARGVPAAPRADGEEMKIVFYDSLRGERCFSESAAVLSASELAASCRLSAKDTLLFTLPLHSPEGFFGGVLAPLLCGACTVCCPSERSVIRDLKLTRSTVILCSPRLTLAIKKKLSNLCRLPIHVFSKKSALNGGATLIKYFCAAEIACRRLLMARVRVSVGGRLRALVSLSEISDDSARALMFFGIECVMVLSTSACIPAAFRYGDDRRRVWTPPRDTVADICDVQRGGIGRITISSPRLCEGSRDGTAVTELVGFITKNGEICLCEHLKRDASPP